MSEILVTLDRDADAVFLRRMIENMKGVLRTKIYSNNSTPLNPASIKETKNSSWVERMRNLSNSVDTSIVDMNDERTRYLMSK